MYKMLGALIPWKIWGTCGHFSITTPSDYTPLKAVDCMAQVKMGGLYLYSLSCFLLAQVLN